MNCVVLLTNPAHSNDMVSENNQQLHLSRSPPSHPNSTVEHIYRHMPESNSLLIIILDVSPLAWGSRDFQRKAQDKARFAKNKSSIGPATLEEVLEAVQAFGGAACSIERDAGLIIIGVADNEVAVVYPRKDGTVYG